MPKSWADILGLRDAPPPGTTEWLVHTVNDPVDGGPATVLLHTKKAKRPAFTTREFCQGCQGGWMRRLDEAVRPLIEKLALAEPISLAWVEQGHLADWAVKTALVWMTKEPRSRQDELGALGLYSRFGRTRHPLPGMHVWIGHRQFEDAGLFRSFTLERTNLAAALADPEPAFGAIIAIRHLLLLVLVTGSPQLSLRLVGPADAAMAPIFPMQDELLWFPRVYGWPSSDLMHFPAAVTRYTQLVQR